MLLWLHNINAGLSTTPLFTGKIRNRCGDGTIDDQLLLPYASIVAYRSNKSHPMLCLTYSEAFPQPGAMLTSSIYEVPPVLTLTYSCPGFGGTNLASARFSFTFESL